MSTPDCRVVIGGLPFADSALDLEALEPTALADVDLTWGRGNTVDQPSPATCRVGVLDRSGGPLFADVLQIGATLELHAAGDIAVGTPVDVAVDGSFETLGLGDPGLRVTVDDPADVLTVIDTPTHTGVRAIQVSSATDLSPVTRVPPASFTPGNPAGWDPIPRLGPNEWAWRIAVHGARNGNISVAGLAFVDPQNPAALAGLIGQYRSFYGDGAWHTLTAPVIANAAQVDAWLGVTVVETRASWTNPAVDNAAITWAEMVDTWAAYGVTVFDDLTLEAPAGGTVRDVLVFSGRITDLAGRIVDRDGSIQVDVTAVDQGADLENRYVGDVPWPAEPVSARVGRIVSASGATVGVSIDDPLGAAVVSWRDVDYQSAGALLTELAAGVDGVLWSATHSTTGPFLWLENAQLRAQVAVLELVGDVVTVVVDTESGRAAGRTTIDGCQVNVAELVWIRDVTDVITRIDTTWLEQTLDGEGKQAPTERSLRVSDPAAEQEHGVRRMGVATGLTTAAAAGEVGDRILARTNTLQGRADGLNWDLGLFPPAAGAEMVAALDLLDGTTRIGRGLIVDDAALWPAGGPIGLYLDGGRYTFDAAGWNLGLVGTPLAGMGESADWDDLEPTWRWDQIDPTLEWPDLYGVAGPLSLLEV